ncbi:4-hydroxy-tetrahydrodipicolinate synthase [Gynuella sp.]|uniref:4-hydroxy-tetrahydrodipicolinate synthase n=1 Tax=Gynuella sp. TaxID=2969146 RepID=UPI003D09EBBC
MFTGSLVAMITPFQNGEIDYPAVHRCLDLHLQHRTQGLVIAGTTGEAPTLSKYEYRKLLHVVCAYVKGRIPVIAGATSYNPVEAAGLIGIAEAAGADAVLCAAGYYNRPNQDGLYRHFHYLHEHSSLPIIIYNIPARTIVDVQPETMARLAELERVVGVKDATGQMLRPLAERNLIDRPFAWLSGDDFSAPAYNAVGGMGVISVVANVLPALGRSQQDACAANDFHRAGEIQQQLLPLMQALMSEPSPAGVKYACSLLDLCTEECRLPIMPLSSASKTAITAAMETLLDQ